MGLINQFRSVIQWENTNEKELFIKFTDRNDEIKNASNLVKYSLCLPSAPNLNIKDLKKILFQ